VRNAGKTVHVVSIAKILWTKLKQLYGIEPLTEGEKQFGFQRAQETVSTLLSDKDFEPLPDELEKQMKELDPMQDVVFLVRVAALGPAIYRSAKLLDEMHGRTMIPIILFYPGTLDGESSLRFLDLPERYQTGAYNYRVRIY